MGSYIAKQPNGLYCRYSTVVDGFTNKDMTEEDYINMCVEKAIIDAKKRLENELVEYEDLINGKY